VAEDLRGAGDRRERLSTAVGFFGIARFVVACAAVVGVVSKLFHVVGLAIFRLFSQYREYPADATAAELVESTERIAGALAALDGDYGLPDEDARTPDPGIQQACFLAHGFGDLTEDAGLDYDASMDGNRIDDLESQHDDQPMDRIERKRREDPESVTDSLRDRLSPHTHPSTPDRIERLQSLRE
jgi:Zn-dependent protease with chaperone function